MTRLYEDDDRVKANPELKLDIEEFFGAKIVESKPVTANADLSSRLDFLKKAVDLTVNSRNKQYGSFDHNMVVFAELLTLYCRERKILAPGVAIQAHDAAYFLSLTKWARIITGKTFHPDNNVDELNYTAEGGWLEYAKLHGLELERD